MARRDLERMTIQILYSSTEGQAKRIAERVDEELRGRGHVTQCENVAKAVMWTKPNAILLIASIHVGKHANAARNLIKGNLPLFNDIPSGFLSVSLSANEADRTRAHGYVRDFMEETGWRPELTATVAGALRYTDYNFVKKLMIKRIATENGLPTDTSRNHEFTDWDEVATFVDTFEQSLHPAAVR
jgi:menaquinone-dependent protoporphyrinogen oxidase